MMYSIQPINYKIEVLTHRIFIRRGSLSLHSITCSVPRKCLDCQFIGPSAAFKDKIAQRDAALFIHKWGYHTGVTLCNKLAKALFKHVFGEFIEQETTKVLSHFGNFTRLYFRIWHIKCFISHLSYVSISKINNEKYLFIFEMKFEYNCNEEISLKFRSKMILICLNVIL